MAVTYPEQWTEPMDPSDVPTQVDYYIDAHVAADQANRCRRLAQSINDRDTARLLEEMANDYERRSSAID
jgi:hypothetical protein